MENPLLQIDYKHYNPVSVYTDNVVAEYGFPTKEHNEWWTMRAIEIMEELRKRISLRGK